MKALPVAARVLRRTPEYDAMSLPDGLRSGHRTAADVWGRIVVVEGALRYRILGSTEEEHVLVAGSPGVVEPGVPHEVEPIGEVRFFVEFLRVPDV